MAAEEEAEDLAEKFIRFVTKNPLCRYFSRNTLRQKRLKLLICYLWTKFTVKRAISGFIERNCSKFSGEAAEEQRLDQHDLFIEYQQLVQRSIDLFISKTKGCSEEEIIKALHTSDNEACSDVVDQLLGMTSYEKFSELMRTRRAKAMASALGDMSSALGRK